MSSHGGSSGGAAPATTVTGPDAFGASAVVGTGTHYARNDHDHGLPAAPASSGLLGRTFYAPSSPDVKNITATSLAVVDATNLTVSYAAPGSGDVLVRLTACTQITLGSYGYWALFDHTSHAQVGITSAVADSGTGGSLSTAFLVTGLTPGTVYQYDWAAATSSQSHYISCQGASGIPSGTNTGPAIMEVWAA